MKTLPDRSLQQMLGRVLPYSQRALGVAPGRLLDTFRHIGSRHQDSSPLPMRVNASMLMLDFIVSSALGYPFWILTARLFNPAEVGLGSAALSAMRLCALVALIGIGSAIVLLLPRDEHRPSDVLSAAFTLAVGSGIAISVAFLYLSRLLFVEFGALVSSPGYALAFMALTLIVVIAQTFDATFMALRRSDKIVARSLVQGIVALAALGVFGLILHTDGTYSILLAWIGAMLASALVGKAFLRRAMPEHHLRLYASRKTTRAMLGVGIPNFALKLAMSLPVHAIPLVVIEVLSPAANAHWRAVWLFGMLVMTVPLACSSALFAEGSNRPDLIDRSARQGIHFSLLLGLPMAGVMALIGGWGLSLMGEGYAAAGTTSLRILVIGVIPQTFIAAYVARARVNRRLVEPTLFGAMSSAVSIGGAVVGGALYGLPGIALAWVGAQCLTGLWAAWKLRAIYDLQLSVPHSVSSTDVRTRVPGADV